jgi:hypothetical protein
VPHRRPPPQGFGASARGVAAPLPRADGMRPGEGVCPETLADGEQSNRRSEWPNCAASIPAA